MKSKIKNSKGFTLVELLGAFSIMIILMAIVTGIFMNFRNSQSLGKDTEMTLSVLRQARSQTLTSQNGTNYGVHFGTTKITLFVGNTYSAGASTNIDFILTGSDTVMAITLVGGGSDIIFKRLSGETSQNGTIVLTSTITGSTKTVTVYKTGLIESN